MKRYDMGVGDKKWKRGKFALFVLVFQVIFIILFGIFVEYGPGAQPKPGGDEDDEGHNRRRRHATNGSHDDDTDYRSEPEEDEVSHFYPMFQDVHVMMFIGFGYLMTFLKRYGFSSLGFNFLICAFVIQWATLMSGFLHLHDGKIQINIETMLTSDFACAAVLISFGAILGKTSPLQLLTCSFLEIIVFQVNEWIGVKHFQVVDVGGSMFVHVFGAYFGITVSRIIYNSSIENEKVQSKESSQYHSDFFSMIGTLFLWMFWPSFNSAIANPGDAQHRAVLNTYYALCTCTLVSFALSSAVDEEDKFEMAHIQNATLAGGVAVGTFADMDIGAWGAMLTGMVAGVVSVLGYKYLTPLLAKVKFHDTCGVNNLHGMPGVIAGLGGIVVAYMADEDKYGKSLYALFPARAPDSQSEIAADPGRYGDIEAGDGWSAGRQAGMQAAALAVTIAMAIVGGTITGFILKLPIWNMPEEEYVFDDKLCWQIPEEGYPHVYRDGKPLPNEGEEMTESALNADDTVKI